MLQHDLALTVGHLQEAHKLLSMCSLCFNWRSDATILKISIV